MKDATRYKESHRAALTNVTLYDVSVLLRESLADPVYSVSHVEAVRLLRHIKSLIGEPTEKQVEDWREGLTAAGEALNMTRN